MKKINFIITIVTLLILSSCSSNDETEPENNLSIIGEWNSKSFIADEPLFDMNKDGINSTEFLEELPCRYSKFVFNTDKTFYQENNFWDSDSNGNYICLTGSDLSTTSGTYEVNSGFSILTLKVGTNSVNIEIEFDGNTFSHRSTSEFFNLDANGNNKEIYGEIFYERN
ncbi:lipoprotein [uncultured Polaribacter sp.]|uniref:lipoprotein n=1 Tax=uncultured Polaribacter sp. TaxID=174711 RepID=UPI00260C2E5B|nr:lipoprotein [uncultured Polaribacter sp.]